MHIYTSVSYLNVPVWAMVFPKKYYFFFLFIETQFTLNCGRFFEKKRLHLNFRTQRVVRSNHRNKISQNPQGPYQERDSGAVSWLAHG